MNNLHKLLEGMDVPELRINDLSWLRRNLAFRNSNHPNFHAAMAEINRLLSVVDL